MSRFLNLKTLVLGVLSFALIGIFAYSCSTGETAGKTKTKAKIDAETEKCIKCHGEKGHGKAMV